MDLRRSPPIVLLASALLSACSAVPSEPKTPARIEPQETNDPRVADVSMRVEDSANGVFSLMGGLASGQGFFVGTSLSIENFDLLDPENAAQPPAPVIGPQVTPLPPQNPPPSTPAPRPPPQVAPEPEGRFTFALEPYFWFIGSDGSANITSGSNRIHSSINTMWDSMDSSWGLRADMGPEPGPYRILFDSNYQSISGDLPSGSLHAYHSMFEGDIAWRTSSKDLLDPLIGARYTDIDLVRINDITDTANSESTGWFDPVVGARGRLPIADRLEIDWRADVGGFGVGSDYTVQLDGAAYFNLSRAFRAYFGWRYLKVEYTSTRLDYEVTTTGPYLGMTFTF